MRAISKLAIWLISTLLGWIVGSLLFSVVFSMLARTLPYFTPYSEGPTYPFVPFTVWLVLGVVALLNSLALFALLPIRRRSQIAALLYGLIVLFLPVRALWQAGYSALTSDRLDWSNGEPIMHSQGKWFVMRLTLAGEEYLVPTLALAITFAVLLLLQDQFGQWLSRRMAEQSVVR